MERALVGKNWENGGGERPRTGAADEPANVAVLPVSTGGGER
jgi:hypothetical protein